MGILLHVWNEGPDAVVVKADDIDVTAQGPDIVSAIRNFADTLSAEISDAGGPQNVPRYPDGYNSKLPGVATEKASP